MPEINPAFDSLRILFFESGQCLATGQGLIPLTWQEIDAWIRVNKLDLTLWEIETIKKMSESYCAEYSRASDPQRPAPYSPEKDADEIDPEEELRKARAYMKLIRSRGKK